MITEILGGALDGELVEYLLSPAIKKMIWSLLFETVQWDEILDSFIVLSIYAIGFFLIGGIILLIRKIRGGSES